MKENKSKKITINESELHKWINTELKKPDKDVDNNFIEGCVKILLKIYNCHLEKSSKGIVNMQNKVDCQVQCNSCCRKT